jgi:hypothetical protein
MKLKIFRANQIVMGISLLTYFLSGKNTILHSTANILLEITLLVMFWFIINATSNFLELEQQINEENEKENDGTPK